MFDGKVVGYALSERMTQKLVMQALFQAVSTRRPGKGLIHHSDQGSQYCGHDDQKMLRQFGMQSSMSRKGNCWDNAPMESCWGVLKTEFIHHRHFETREQAKREITEYVEIFYNRIRKQARLGYLSPAAYIHKCLCTTDSRLIRSTLRLPIDLSAGQPQRLKFLSLIEREGMNPLLQTEGHFETKEKTTKNLWSQRVFGTKTKKDQSA